MGDQYTVVSQSIVHVKISSNATSFLSERKIPKDMLVHELKGKLELQTGCSCLNMKLEVYDKNDKLVCHIDDDSALFGSYPVDDDMRLHVIDPTKKLGEFEDVSKVEKFELSEEEYNKRSDSVRAFKQRMKLGQFAETDPGVLQQQAEEKLQKEKKELEMIKAIQIGSRCEVRMPNTASRRAEVMFVGETSFKPGQWVGVKYDEPVGKNDGSVQGHKYFECLPKYGGFVKPEHVVIGDFPEEGFSDEDLDEI